MNWIKLLNTIFIGMLVYVMLSVFVGKQGIWAYAQLQEYKVLITSNIKNLQDINEKITIDKKTMLNDDDTIAAYARSMGFIYDNENLVKITGIPVFSNAVYETGAKINPPQIIYMPDWMAKGIGFCVFLFVNLISSLVFLLKTSSVTRKKTLLGTTNLASKKIYDTKKI